MLKKGIKCGGIQQIEFGNKFKFLKLLSLKIKFRSLENILMVIFYFFNFYIKNIFLYFIYI
jgi:hypothetical protein